MRIRRGRARSGADDDLLPTLEIVADEAGTSVDVQIRRRHGHRRRPGSRQRLQLLAHRRDGARRVDLAVVVIDAPDVCGMSAVEDPVAVRPDAVTVARPRPAGKRSLGWVAAGFGRERADLPLHLDLARVVGVREQILEARVDGEVRVLVVRVVHGREVGVGDEALVDRAADLLQLLARIDPDPAGLRKAPDVDEAEQQDGERVAARAAAVNGLGRLRGLQSTERDDQRGHRADAHEREPMRLGPHGDHRLPSRTWRFCFAGMAASRFIMPSVRDSPGVPRPWRKAEPLSATSPYRHLSVTSKSVELSPDHDLERPRLEFIDDLAEFRHPFLITGKAPPAPDGLHRLPGTEAHESLRIVDVAEKHRVRREALAVAPVRPFTPVLDEFLFAASLHDPTRVRVRRGQVDLLWCSSLPALYSAGSEHATKGLT